MKGRTNYHVTCVASVSPTLPARHPFILRLTHAVRCKIMLCSCVWIITVKLLAEFDFAIIVLLLLNQIKYEIEILNNDNNNNETFKKDYISQRLIKIKHGLLNHIINVQGMTDGHQIQ